MELDKSTAASSVLAAVCVFFKGLLLGPTAVVPSGISPVRSMLIGGGVGALDFFVFNVTFVGGAEGSNT
jgi:hypothetical protein